jgi:hypothetical protein
MEALGHDGTPLRPTEAVRYLNAQGVKVTTQDIKNWVHRGLPHTDTDDQGHKLYDLLTIYKKAKTA